MQHNPGFIALCEEAKKQITEVTIEQVADWLTTDNEPPELAVLDIREKDEWEAGHIVGARYMGRGILERDIETHYPDRGTPLVLYCGGGFRSALSALNLQQMGYTKVMSMAGGIRAWREAALPEV